MDTKENATFHYDTVEMENGFNRGTHELALELT